MQDKQVLKNASTLTAGLLMAVLLGGCVSPFGDGSSLQAHFVVSPSEPTVGEEVSFIAVADETFGVTAWMWDFGDGETSTSQNPRHTYHEAGTYTVRLVTTNSTGVGTVSERIISVLPLESVPIDPGFDAYICDGYFSVGGTWHSGNHDIVSYFWDFGDGETLTTSSAWAEHTYSSKYSEVTITLTVTDEVGDTGSVTKDVDLTRCDEPTFANSEIEARFKYSGEDPEVCGESIQFTDTSLSNSAIESWFWDFGDGNTSSEQNPTHTYRNPEGDPIEESFTVTLTVTNIDGYSDEHYETIPNHHCPD